MTEKITVSKFGGSSMADAEAMKRSAKIVLREHSQLVVVSATYGTTNHLLALCDLSLNGEEEKMYQLLGEIVEKHSLIAEELKASNDSYEQLEEIFEELRALSKGIYLLKDCSLKTKDAFLSIGERLSSVLFTEALRSLSNEKKVKLFDARNVIRTDSQFSKATPIIKEIKSLCDLHLTQCKHGKEIVVTQGFIGMTKEGLTTTLGRGGSDFSAALFAEGLEADILQIWTDVAGVATTDPRICSKAVPISRISFREAQELATFGAKVLHPETLAPAIRKNIPVFVGSSYHSEQLGTWIDDNQELQKSSPLVRAMALRKNQVLLTITTPKMLHTSGFLHNIFRIFHEHKVSIDSITTSEISVAVTLDDATLLNLALLEELEQYADIEVERNLSLVSLIGNRINHTPGLAQKIFTSLGEINVRMICLGASKHNFCFLVNEREDEEAIKRLHHDFIEKELL